jgi:propionyl-CoA carboxylase beta chain
MTDPLDTLAALERRAELGGGEERLKRHHDAGKLTARERIELLFDPGTPSSADRCRRPTPRRSSR